MRDKLAITNIVKAIQKVQKIQKIGQQITNHKHCLSVFVLFLLVVVPHNISAVCSSDIDMDTHSLINVDELYFNGRIIMYDQKSFEIAGVRYVSALVSDGMFASTNSRTCTSTNGNSYYLVSKNDRLTACPADSSVITIGATNNTPTPAQVSSIIGNNVAAVSTGCLTNRFYMITDDTDMYYKYFSGSTPSGDWQTVSWGSGGWEGLPLCKLDFQ